MAQSLGSPERSRYVGGKVYSSGDISRKEEIHVGGGTARAYALMPDDLDDNSFFGIAHRVV